MRIYVRVTPKAGRLSLEPVGDDEYRARLTVPPEGGRANEQLIGLLAEHFGVAKSLVRIAGGKTARTKMVDIDM